MFCVFFALAVVYVIVTQLQVHMLRIQVGSLSDLVIVDMRSRKAISDELWEGYVKATPALRNRLKGKK